VDLALRIVDGIAGLPPGLLYLAVLAYMLGQSAGAPLSSEALLLFGGYLVSIGRLNPILLWLAATVGSVGGASIAWYIADRWGPAGVDRVGRYILLSRSKLRTAHRFFERRGVVAILIARVLPLVQSYISYPAGLADMSFRPFIAATAAGAAVWCLGLILVGNAAGPHWAVFFHLTNGPLLAAGTLVILAVAVFLVYQQLTHSRRRGVARD
jgi:membrane protein DedA with SNARE-associated domain